MTSSTQPSSFANNVAQGVSGTSSNADTATHMPAQAGGKKPHRMWWVLGVTAVGITATILLGPLIRAIQGDTGYQTPMWAIWVHLATAVPAVPLGAWLLLRRKKGDMPHRIGGRIWAVIMIITAIDSFWIRGLTGGIGPIHIFSVVTLVTVPLSVWHAMNGRIVQHQRMIKGAYFGLIGAGVFAMLPGRFLMSYFL